MTIPFLPRPSSGPEYQAESLNDQEGIKENFQDKADPTYTAQMEAMEQGDLEKAEGTDEGSKMISEDGNRHDMHPPSDMREGADRASFDERMNQDRSSESQVELELDRRDDRYEDGSEFDSGHENGSDYNDEYEP